MSKTLKYALLVFAGGWCYGIVVPLVRVVHTMGFSSAQAMALQYLVGVVTLGALVLIFFRRRIPWRQMLQLGGVGLVAAGVSFGYYNALALLSSAAAITLLFQFVWMGAVLQALIERKLPNRRTVISVCMIFVGTFLAAGIFEWGFGALNPLGIFYGLLSAVFYTAFLHLSGRVATDLPTVNRTLFTNAGSLIASFFLVPTFFTTGAILGDFTWVAFPLALLGIVAPVLLIQKGAPHLPNGVTTIMASSELPSGVIMGAVFVGDPITFLEILGILIILAGIVVSQLDALRQRQTKEPR